MKFPSRASGEPNPVGLSLLRNPRFALPKKSREHFAKSTYRGFPLSMFAPADNLHAGAPECNHPVGLVAVEIVTRFSIRMRNLVGRNLSSVIREHIWKQLGLVLRRCGSSQAVVSQRQSMGDLCVGLSFGSPIDRRYQRNPVRSRTITE